MSKNVPILYSYWRSSCSWRVRIALNLKKIPYKYEVIDMLKGDQHSTVFKEKGCFGLIPVLFVNNVYLTESLAIIEYLEEKYPNSTTLLPGTPEDRAKIRALSLQIIANTQPLQNLKVLKYLSDDLNEKNKWARHWINITFLQLEEVLNTTSGKYSYGDQITLLDLCIPPQVYNARRFGLDLTPFPIITRIDKTLNEIPEFKAAHCFNQPDTPESEKKNVDQIY